MDQTPQPPGGPRRWWRHPREAAPPPADAQRQAFAIPKNYSTMTPQQQPAWPEKVMDAILPADDPAARPPKS